MEGSNIPGLLASVTRTLVYVAVPRKKLFVAPVEATMTIGPSLIILIVLAVPSTNSAFPFPELYLIVSSSRETVEGSVIVAG